MARFINGVAFAFLVGLLLQCASAQTLHVVGDDIGWTIPPGGAQAYTNWASGKSFMVGDILMFNYTTNEHDVLRVTKVSFDACTSTDAIGDIITTGPTNVTLDAAGEHYYICTIGRHCSAGQKLAITVSSGTPGPPTGTPTPTTPTTPTTPSTPVDPNACAPVPSPSPSVNGGSDPTTITPPPPGSSAPSVFASVLVTMLAIGMGLFF